MGGAAVFIILYFGLVFHIGNIINGNESFGVQFVNEIHQFLIFGFVYNGNDLIAFLHIVGTVCFIDRGTAVEFVDNKLPEFFLFPGDDTYPALDVVVKNKMVQNDAVEISSQDT